MDKLQPYLLIAPEVQRALLDNKPVVALESTSISHGMPYPRNVETAQHTEQIIREEGAVPATIAVLEGKLRIGISGAEIEYLGREGNAVYKASRRDLPALVARGQDGATTVAATLILAALAGIRVFSTGGIGGVHRGAAATMDVSADLDEFGRTSALVVCAGPQSILDLGLTLEYLETKGVPVIGFGTDELPAFYTQKSGFSVDYRIDSPAEAAQIFSIKESLGLRGSMLVTNPIPQEFDMEIDSIATSIAVAVAEAEQNGIKGKELTPFLLERIRHITNGKSLEANIQLVHHNARLATRIAREYCALS